MLSFLVFPLFIFSIQSNPRKNFQIKTLPYERMIFYSNR